MCKKKNQSKLIFKDPTTTSGVLLGHFLTNLIIKALLDVNANRKLGKFYSYMDSEMLKTPKTDYLLTDYEDEEVYHGFQFVNLENTGLRVLPQQKCALIMYLNP